MSSANRGYFGPGVYPNGPGIALADRAMSSVQHKVEGATGRLTDYVAGDGGPGLRS